MQRTDEKPVKDRKSSGNSTLKKRKTGQKKQEYTLRIISIEIHKSFLLMVNQNVRLQLIKIPNNLMKLGRNE